MTPEAEVLEIVERLRPAASRYRGAFDHEDAAQELAVGVLTAARTFDPSRGVAFITFAAKHARGTLAHTLRDHVHPIRGPRGTPWPQVVPFDDQRDGVHDPEADDRLALHVAIRLLPVRERAAIFGLFFLGQTQTELARRLGCSQRHVSRLLAQGLRRLRGVLTDAVSSSPRAAG
jgi:RNA polymerase sigma factor (sigma-70 family)